MHRSVIAGGDLSDAKSEDANVVRNLCREIFENAARNNCIFIPLRSVARGSKRTVSVSMWCQWGEEQAERFLSVAVQYVMLRLALKRVRRSFKVSTMRTSARR